MQAEWGRLNDKWVSGLSGVWLKGQSGTAWLRRCGTDWLVGGFKKPWDKLRHEAGYENKQDVVSINSNGSRGIKLRQKRIFLSVRRCLHSPEPLLLCLTSFQPIHGAGSCRMLSQYIETTARPQHVWGASRCSSPATSTRHRYSHHCQQLTVGRYWSNILGWGYWVWC